MAHNNGSSVHQNSPRETNTLSATDCHPAPYNYSLKKKRRFEQPIPKKEHAAGPVEQVKVLVTRSAVYTLIRVERSAAHSPPSQ